mgnify:CR=1 FL=1
MPHTSATSGVGIIVLWHNDSALADEVQEVNGLGVVGHQPLLPPGESFEYTSWATIKTPVGTMRGEYFCVAEDGHRFEAPIPEFALVMPRMLGALYPC